LPRLEGPAEYIAPKLPTMRIGNDDAERSRGIVRRIRSAY